MRYSKADLRAIYDRTSGKCHICGKQLALTNYGLFGEKGAWEVEHSHGRARGGTDRLNNLYSAHISCNRSKGAVTTRTARAWEGRTRAPLSREKRNAAKRGNALAGGVLGAIVGSVFGPVGTWVGGAAGAYLGHKQNPDKA